LIINHVGLAVLLPDGVGRALLDRDLKGGGKEAHYLRMPNPRNRLESRLGGVGVEAEEYGVGASVKGRRDVGIGCVQLAFHGDPLHAEACGDGEMLDAAGEQADDFRSLPAEPGAIGDRSGEEEQAKHEPLAAHTIRAELAEPHGFGAAPQYGAHPAKRRHPSRGAAGDGNSSRKERILRSPSPNLRPSGAQRLHEASSTIHLTSSPNERPLCAASSGTSDVPVIPGWVLTSRQINSPVPSGRSS